MEDEGWGGGCVNETSTGMRSNSQISLFTRSLNVFTFGRVPTFVLFLSDVKV